MLPLMKIFSSNISMEWVNLTRSDVECCFPYIKPGFVCTLTICEICLEAEGERRLGILHITYPHADIITNYNLTIILC